MSGLSDLAEEFPERRQRRARSGYRRGSKRYCPHGHEYTPENSVLVIRPGRPPTRRCRKCRNMMTKRWKVRVGYRAKVNRFSRIGRALDLLDRAAAVLLDAGLAAEIRSFLAAKVKA